MSNITEPVDGYEVNGDGYITVSGELDAIDGYAWLVMGRQDWHYLIWPKAQVSQGPFTHSIFEDGGNGGIICRLIVVNDSDNQKLQDSFVNKTGAHCPEFVQLASIKLLKT